MAKFDRVRYVGGGRHILGLPMADLSGDEWYALPAEDRKRALALGLYEGVHASGRASRHEDDDGLIPAADLSNAHDQIDPGTNAPAGGAGEG